jgi:hypothetical protein
VAGFNAACKTVAATTTSFSLSDGQVALALGDVSGKGMPASLLMMALHAQVQVLADDPKNLGELMMRLNKATCANCPSNRFITFFFCVFDAATGELRFANAGHNPPMVVRASGETEMLEGGGPVLGILPAAQFTAQRTQLNPRLAGDLQRRGDGGDGPQEDEYGEERHRSAQRTAAARRGDRGGGDEIADGVERGIAAGGRRHIDGGEAATVMAPPGAAGAITVQSSSA